MITQAPRTLPGTTTARARARVCVGLVGCMHVHNRVLTHKHMHTYALRTCSHTGGKIVQIIYKAGKNSQSQSQRNAEIITGSISVSKGVHYLVTAEVLRNDMGSASEKLASITLDGVQMLPRGGCNPPGSDYSCDFWTCPVVSAAKVMSNTGSIAVAFDVKETSWDCDCDTSTWQCSKESTVRGRTPMEAAVRFTLTAGVYTAYGRAAMVH